MHLNSFEVWLWLKLDDIVFFLAVASALLMILGGFIWFIAFLDEYESTLFKNFTDESRIKLLRFGRISFLFGLILFIIALVIPDTEEFATIYILPKVVNSKTAQKVFKDGDKIGVMMIKHMEQKLNELLNESK